MTENDFTTPRRVAIFGGTFDPFTVAHRAICKQAMDEMPIDKLYIIPTVVSYHREGKDRWLCNADRVKVVRSMLWSLGEEYMGKWEVDTHELELQSLCEKSDEQNNRGRDDRLYDSIIEPRRFVHTLLDFKTRVGLDTKIDLILGTDSARNFATWYHWQDVAANVSAFVIVQGRDGKEVKTLPFEVARKLHRKSGVPSCSMDIPEEFQDVSASKIRKRIEHGYYTVDDYLAEVKSFDNGEESLNRLGWTEKKGKK